MNKIIPLFDRSRSVTDWKCPRSRYLNYEVGGTGIVPLSTNLALYSGTTIHDALAAIALGQQANRPVDIDALANLAYRQMFENLYPEGTLLLEQREFAEEQATLIEGLIRGFYKYAWPSLLARWPKVLFVEQEMTYNYSGVKFMAKPDLVLQSEDGLDTVYVEYKSTSSKQDKWINSWGTAVQLHSTCRAIEQTTGTKVSQVVVQGLYKGYESYGKQNSPFCYCYLKKGQPPFSKDEISYEFKYGFKRSPTWQLPGGLKKWIDDMPEVVLADQFPQTPPIFVKEELVEAFFTQRAIREKEIAKGVQEVSESLLALDEYFPQRFDQCQPSFGFACPYVPICHGYVTNPLEQGFVEREPHHEEELLRFEARRDSEPR